MMLKRVDVVNEAAAAQLQNFLTALTANQQYASSPLCRTFYGVATGSVRPYMAKLPRRNPVG